MRLDLLSYLLFTLQAAVFALDLGIAVDDPGGLTIGCAAFLGVLVADSTLRRFRA